MQTVDGKLAIVDGTNGVLYVEPDEETLATYALTGSEEEQEKKELLQTLKGRETVTMDGTEDPPVCQHWQQQGSGVGHSERCGGHRTVPQRIFVSGKRNISDGGGAVPGI